MNEPSVFNGFEGTFPMTNLHLNDQEKVTMHGEIHNAYGQMMHKVTHEALLERDKGQVRPFVLSRSVFTGS
jgi:alpha-glucosidase (family GH31 glycosyl hydrolase)